MRAFSRADFASTITVGGLLLALAGLPASGQQAAAPAPPPLVPYGTPITLETARKVMAASEAEAAKNGWPMAIAILDSTGHIVMLHRMDNTQYGSIQVAIDKAVTSVDFRRPSKVFEDGVAGGGIGLRILGIKSVSPIEGGIPIIVGGKLIGAVGVSGGTASQDGQVAKAGVVAVAAN